MNWESLITVLIAFAGILLAMSRSTWIVDYTVFVFVFNRGLRRLVDFYINQEFNPLSPISLSPLVVAGSMMLPVVFHLAAMPGKARWIFLTFAAAVVYAFVIGFLSFGNAAVYSLGETMAPLALFGYVLLLNPSVAVKDRWVRSFSWAAILASAYGWYQYLTIPPWDKFWLIETEMYGYMGIPEPTKMSVFSTMAERGPLAGFLGFAVVPMVVERRWRGLPGIFGWAAVILVFSTIFLTLSRGGLLFAILGVGCYLIINRGRGSKQIAVMLGILAIASLVGMSRIPNAERIVDRYESLGELEEDGSYKGRVEIMSTGFSSLFQRPLGLGLGGAGMAARVAAPEDRAGRVVDAGWFNILLVYGIPGGLLLLAALGQAWALLAMRFRRPEWRDGHVLLARAMMITLIPACFVGDLLTGFSIFWLALGSGIAMSRSQQRVSMVHGMMGGSGGALLAREQAAPPLPAQYLRAEQRQREKKGGGNWL